jgi:hypothetical protein
MGTIRLYKYAILYYRGELDNKDPSCVTFDTGWSVEGDEGILGSSRPRNQVLSIACINCSSSAAATSLLVFFWHIH